MKKNGQVTLFIILAIIVVGSIIAYFALRGSFSQDIPEEMRPVYDYYLSCLEEVSHQGIALLGQQGGYLDLPEFVPGSQYMPFSSQLDFLGQPVPYWMYVSGNNLLKEQIPTLGSMESQLGDFVSKRVSDCDFTDFEREGYSIYVDEGSVNVKINKLDVDLDINNRVTIFRGNQSVVVSNHDVLVNSKLGKFYGLALDVYSFEKSEMFLEAYALDVMRLYAPVTGTDITCTPKIFVDEIIREDIVSGLAANIPSLKLEGEYYDLSDKERNYFVTDTGKNIDENVNFMYSPDWPTKIEIYGDRVAKPVGLQEGLGILGFCYVPYHLVYDIGFPVMIQFYDTEEIFQFPVSIIISKNQAREALPTTGGALIESKVCEFNNQPVEISTYDTNLNPVEARLQFKCLDSVCEVGETQIEGGVSIFQGNLPQCVNGFLVVSAEGYADTKYPFSTNEESLANVVLSKKFEIPLDLGNVDKALVTFSSEDYSTTALYPEISSVDLIEGYYNVTVYVYDNSSLKFPSIDDRRCVDVPESGLAGVFGAETEKCFDISIPETDISFAVVGGGNTQEYFTEGMLDEAVGLKINIPLFGLPGNLEELQENHVAVNEERIYLEFV
jgi:hypothetical protein